MLNLFLHCTTLTTRIPLDRFMKFDQATMMKSLVLLPVVGGVLGILGVSFFLISSPFLPKAIMVALVITLLILLTGAFEEDAFADAVDGFGGGKNKKHIIKIMRDSRIGTYGTLALLLAIGFEFIFLFYTPVSVFPKMLFFAMMGSRFTALPLIWKFPYIDDSSSYVNAFELHRKSIGGLKVVFSFFLVVVTGYILFGNNSFWIIAALLVTATITGYYYFKKLQGVTGDCLGATLKISEIVVLFFGVILS